MDNNLIKHRGRGAQINTLNRFESYSREIFLEDAIHDADILLEDNETQITEVHPKSILNRVESPDVPGDWSLNPYQGCEHGCVYCYARTTHEFLGYSAGKDFERKIMVKANAAELLDKKLSSSSWKASPIMLSGNTDCYQPVEKKLKITRKILEVCLKHQHPIGIITKNALVCRDIDLLAQLAAKNLVHVHMSITTLNEKIRRTLEPRTSSAKNRLRAVKALSDNGIPVSVMMAPIIPGLTSDEIFDIAEQSVKAGATCMSATMVRLNGSIGLLFEDWIQRAFPLKATRVLNLIASAQGGKLGNSTFGERMRGTGAFAESIQQQVKLAIKKNGLSIKMPAFNCSLHNEYKQKQLVLF